jgi:spore germination protein YaaH
MSDSTSDVQPEERSTPLEQPNVSSSSFGERFGATLSRAREQLSLGAWLYGVIGILIVVVLLLPPISLLRRLGVAGYATLDAAHSSVVHPDGLTLSVDPETFTERLRVRQEAVPRLEFLEGSAGGALRQAVEALPEHLEVKSPLYNIGVRGKALQPVMIDVVMPNDAVPWETLDLYIWTGEAWEWIGSELHAEVAEHEFIRARVTEIPDSIVVVQAGAVTPSVSTSVESDDDLASPAAGAVDEINPTGLLLGTDGGFVGDPGSLVQAGAEAGYVVLPTLRNWAPGATVNRGLLSDVLTIPEIQDAHIANIVELCNGWGYAGVDVDYRGLVPEQREAYADFVAALADALHAAGLRLTVVVEPPLPTDGGWEAGGYDWAALGAAADGVKVSFPDDPAAYVEGGKAHRILEWATAQVPRYKLRMQLSSLSTEQSGDTVRYVSLEEALALFGEVVAFDDVSGVESGSQVQFGLAGRVLSITPQEEAGTYRLEYEGDGGETRTVWLGTATNLAAKLEWAQRYHLGGIAVSDLFDPGNVAGIVDVVSGYRAGAVSAASQEMQVAWTAASAAATVDQQVSPLTEPGYTWTVLASTGTYTVGAKVAGFDHGSVVVVVGEPEPAATETVTGAVASGEVTPTAEMASVGGGAVAGCLDASYVADVTIPDNTQFDNGEEFEKTWRVRNAGTCAWPEDTVLAFSSGERMDAPDSVEVGSVDAGGQVDVTAKMKAPADAGRYTGVWQMKTVDGFFGGNLSVVIQAGEVAAAPAAAVAPISGGSFELGGHVRDTGLPYADTMRYAGMNWTKVQVHYGQDASGLIAAHHAKGFKIQLSALGSADMVTKSGFEQDFANWVARLAADGADAIEVWNEPNIDREWQIGQISPQAYTNLLCTSYNAIKGANPGTAVISAAPSPTGYFGGCSPNGCDDAPWMAGLRDAGAANCMDYIGAHHNAGATAPSARSGHPAGTHHSWYFLPQTELYYNTFGGARKLFYTEMGYASQEGVPTFSDWFGWARGTNNAQQAAWLAEAVQLSVSSGMVRCIIVWNIDYVRYGDDPQDGYAIVRPGGGCPACDALHNVLGTR